MRSLLSSPVGDRSSEAPLYLGLWWRPTCTWTTPPAASSPAVWRSRCEWVLSVAAVTWCPTPPGPDGPSPLATPCSWISCPTTSTKHHRQSLTKHHNYNACSLPRAVTARFDYNIRLTWFDVMWMFLCDHTLLCLADCPSPLMSCMHYNFYILYIYISPSVYLYINISKVFLILHIWHTAIKCALYQLYIIAFNNSIYLYNVISPELKFSSEVLITTLACL